MKNIDSTYVFIGTLWLLIGLTLGIIMGGSHNFQFMPVHAHIALVGFACHSVFGLAYRQWPTMKASGLAASQFWVFVLSTPIMLIGLALELSGRGGSELPLIIGSIGIFAGALLFCIIIWRARRAN